MLAPPRRRSLGFGPGVGAGASASGWEAEREAAAAAAAAAVPLAGEAHRRLDPMLQVRAEGLSLAHESQAFVQSVAA